ncbi:MAG: hypothetical protein LBQ48_00480 [Oscillospiraceae bacterium]|nr:hypothetical protein [Oscillospiraceae bacterium]
MSRTWFRSIAVIVSGCFYAHAEGRKERDTRQERGNNLPASGPDRLPGAVVPLQ